MWVGNLKAISTYQKENTISVYIYYIQFECVNISPDDIKFKYKHESKNKMLRI